MGKFMEHHVVSIAEIARTLLNIVPRQDDAPVAPGFTQEVVFPGGDGAVFLMNIALCDKARGIHQY